MRPVTLFLFLCVGISPALAQQALPPNDREIQPPPAAAPAAILAPSFTDPSLSLEGRSITSTLQPIIFGEAEPEEGGGLDIDDLYPRLPIAKDAPKIPNPGPPGGLVDGFQLNRQLVESTAREYPSSGVELGQGWNSFLNRPAANVCIEANTRRLPGQEVNSAITVVEDRASFLRTMSASAGASYGPFSGSASYSTSNAFSSYDVNVLMNATVDTGGEFLGPGEERSVRLSDVALQLLTGNYAFVDPDTQIQNGTIDEEPTIPTPDPNGLDRFLQACGDSFVTAYRNGGRMTGLLTIRDRSQKFKEDIEAQAKGGFGAFSANGSFRQSVETAQQNSDLSVSYGQVGGIISGIPVTLDDFVVKFTQYRVGEDFNPRPYVFFTHNYRTLPNWPAGLENRVTPVDQEFFLLAYQNFSDLAGDYDRAIAELSSYVPFLTGGQDRIKEYRDIALLHARNIDRIIWECVEAFDCSDRTLYALDAVNRDQIRREITAVEQRDNGSTEAGESSLRVETAASDDATGAVSGTPETGGTADPESADAVPTAARPLRQADQERLSDERRRAFEEADNGNVAEDTRDFIADEGFERGLVFGNVRLAPVKPSPTPAASDEPPVNGAVLPADDSAPLRAPADVAPPTDGAATPATNDATSTTPLPAPTQPDVILPSLVASHYRLLAALPLYNQDDGGTGFETTAPALQDPLPEDTRADANDALIISELKEWLIAHRLRPASRSHCRISANHPLCLSDREMSHIVALLDFDVAWLRRKAEAPQKPPEKTPPAQPPKTRPMPPDSIRGPCFHRPNICY